MTTDSRSAYAPVLSRLGRRGALILLAALSDCAVQPDGDARVSVVTRDESGHYGLAPSTIAGLTSDPLASPHFRVIAGAEIVGETLTTPGVPFVARFEDGDPLVPIDFETLVAVTTLDHMEHAFAFYESLGLADFGPLPAQYPLYFYPKLAGELPFTAFTDNAAFSSELNGLIIVPERVLADISVPLAMNPSVTTHELGHAVFHHLTNEHLVGRADEPHNHMRALNEGLADTFAIAFIGNPSILADSGPGVAAIFDFDARDVRIARTFDAGQESDLDFKDAYTDPYPVGTLVARTFWRVSELRADALGGQRAALVHGAKLALATLGVFTNNDPEHVLDFFEDLLALPDLAPEDHAAFCTALGETFTIAMDRLGGCP